MDHLRNTKAARDAFFSREAVRGGSSVATREVGAGSWFFGAAMVRGAGGRALNNCGQATKGAWGMSWRQKTMTGVEDCEKSGVVVKQTLIPECPNQPALNP